MNFKPIITDKYSIRKLNSSKGLETPKEKMLFYIIFKRVFLHKG